MDRRTCGRHQDRTARSGVIISQDWLALAFAVCQIAIPQHRTAGELQNRYFNAEVASSNFCATNPLREPLLSGKFVNPVHIPFHKDVQELPCALVRDVAVVGDQTVSVSDIDFRLSHTWNVEIAQH